MRHDGARGGGGKRSTVQARDGNLLRADDAVAASKARPLHPFRGGENRELLAAQISDFALGRPRLLAEKIDEALAGLSLERVRLLALSRQRRGRRRFRGRRNVSAGGAAQRGRGDPADHAYPVQAALDHSSLSYGSRLGQTGRVLP